MEMRPVIATLVLMLLSTLLSGCGPEAYTPGSIGAAIREHKAEVPVQPEGNASGRIDFSNVKFSYSEDNGTKTIRLWCDVLRKRSDDDGTLHVKVHVYLYSQPTQEFSESISVSTLDLSELAKLHGGVPLHIGVTIEDEK
jgi:hypothetical protein